MGCSSSSHFNHVSLYFFHFWWGCCLLSVLERTRYSFHCILMNIIDGRWILLVEVRRGFVRLSWCWLECSMQLVDLFFGIFREEVLLCSIGFSILSRIISRLLIKMSMGLCLIILNYFMNICKLKICWSKIPLDLTISISI